MRTIAVKVTFVLAHHSAVELRNRLNNSQEVQCEEHYSLRSLIFEEYSGQKYVSGYARKIQIKGMLLKQ